MKIPHITILCICLLWLTPCRAFIDKNMHQLTMRDGLSGNTINSICQDRQGFIWLSTGDALDRFDGERVRCFPFDKPNANISNLISLSDDILCFNSKDTLYAFNLKAERFIPVLDEYGHRIIAFDMQVSNDSTLWILTDTGQLLTAKNVKQDTEAVIVKTQCHYMFRDSTVESRQNRLALSPDGKFLCVADTSGKLLIADVCHINQYTTIYLEANQPISINHILYDDNGLIWIATTGQGIICYDTKSGKKVQLTHSNKYATSQLSHTDVFRIVCMGNDRYFATTWNGYTLLTIENGDFSRITTQVFNNTTSHVFRDIDSHMITAYYAPQGTLWIGTDGGGLIWSDLKSQFYERFYQDTHNEICSIIHDDEGYVWLATFHKGIMRSRSPFGDEEWADFVPAGDMDIRNIHPVLCCTKDIHGNLWFGNADGSLICYNIRSKQFRHIQLTDGKSFSNKAAVWSLLADSRGHLWIGTQEGLLVLETSTGLCRQIEFTTLDDTTHLPLHIRAMAETNDNVIWLGTVNNGVCRYDVHKNNLDLGYENRAGMEGNAVRSLLASSDGFLYIGYVNAFAVLSPNENAIVHTYTKHDGLCNDFIGCIAEDGRGNIWLGSNSGITRYDKQLHIFHNYYISEGNRSALFWQDMLFWGNNKNLTYFAPNEIETFESPHKVLITGIVVNGRHVEINQKNNGQVILTEAVSYQSGISLNHANRNFSLAFNNLSYSDEPQLYAYRLYPYQEEWTYTYGKANKYISYTDLKQGEYEFEVRSTYPNSSDPLGNVTTLRISIDPLWSHTILFRIFLLMSAGVVVYFCTRRFLVGNEPTGNAQSAPSNIHFTDGYKQADLQLETSHGTKEEQKPNEQISHKALILKDDSQANETSEEDYLIRQIIQVIETHLSDEAFNVKTLANELNMSQPTLYRKIKQRSQLNAIEMIRQVRMNKAALLISEKRYSIQEIAEKVGYNDTRTLRKHFTAQFGVSPSKYCGEEKSS